MLTIFLKEVRSKVSHVGGRNYCRRKVLRERRRYKIISENRKEKLNRMPGDAECLFENCGSHFKMTSVNAI